MSQSILLFFQHISQNCIYFTIFGQFDYDTNSYPKVLLLLCNILKEISVHILNHTFLEHLNLLKVYNPGCIYFNECDQSDYDTNSLLMIFSVFSTLLAMCTVIYSLILILDASFTSGSTRKKDFASHLKITYLWYDYIVPKFTPINMFILFHIILKYLTLAFNNSLSYSRDWILLEIYGEALENSFQRPITAHTFLKELYTKFQLRIYIYIYYKLNSIDVVWTYDSVPNNISGNFFINKYLWYYSVTVCIKNSYRFIFYLNHLIFSITWKRSPTIIPLISYHVKPNLL